MKNRTLALILALILITVPVIAFGGCTSYLDFSGYAYEWTNAPAGTQSMIIEADKLPEGYEVKPIVGVAVEANDEDKSHPFIMVSGNDGYFHKGLTVEVAEDIIIKVDQPGFKPAELQFDVDKDTYFYSLIVLLVPG